MIQKNDILNLHFYDYKMAFTGSQGMMRYRIIKAEHELKENETEPCLLVTVWRGPYAYDYTQEEKIQKEFPFSNEGKEAAVDWLNEEYIEISKNKS